MVVLFQVTVVFLYSVLAVKNRENSALWISLISCFLISCAWWENFVNDNATIFACLKDLKNDIEECRHFLYMIIPLWKIALMLASCVLFLYTIVRMDKGEIKSLFKVNLTNFNISIELPESFDLDFENVSTAANVSRVVWPSDLLSTDHWIRFLPIIITFIHVASSYLCFISGKFACKICIQGFSYALPLVLSVPSTMSLLYFFCGKRISTNCHEYSDTFRHVLPYLLWKCPEGNLLDFYYKDKWGFLWIFWIISQVWLTRYIWISKTKRMASTNE